jgi:hypothetical protein
LNLEAKTVMQRDEKYRELRKILGEPVVGH